MASLSFELVDFIVFIVIYFSFVSCLFLSLIIFFVFLLIRAMYPAILFRIFLLGRVFPSIFLFLSNVFPNVLFVSLINCLDVLLISVDFILPMIRGVTLGLKVYCYIIRSFIRLFSLIAF